MRFNSLSLIVWFLFCAQGIKAESPDSTDHTPFTAGTKALQFRIGSDFSLNPFQGSLISYQKQLTAEKARRIGISIYTDLEKDDHSVKDEWYNPVDSSYSIKDDSVSNVDNSLNLSISSQVIKNKPFNSGFFLYWGIGPIIIFDYKKYNNTFKQKDGNRRKYLTMDLQLGLSGVVGVEWFIKENMSLLAEYGPTILVGYKYINNYFEEHSSYGSYQKRDVTTEGTSFSISSGVKFGLSIYLER